MIGGIAGDMFAAALVDLEPALAAVCRETVNAIAGLPDDISIEIRAHDKAGRFGHRLQVSRQSAKTGKQASHPHLSHREARRIVTRSDLPAAVQRRATDIFALLAAAEGFVHDMPADDVVFHEVGGWDSVVDIILAARLIEEVGKVSWQCGTVPIGSGSVECAHGTLPVPAPAVVELLKGMAVQQDGRQGERVTPTGAAILRHLQPRQVRGVPAARMLAAGSGFGSRQFEGLANVLRVFRLEESLAATDRVMSLEFDIDDQTPEDLAIALDDLRATKGVLDVAQIPALGKKGRLLAMIRVLVEPEIAGSICNQILSATSTLGVRYHELERATLDRRELKFQGESASLKVVRRPDGNVTAKMDADSLKNQAGSYGRRKRIRREREARAEEDLTVRPDPADGND